MPLPEDSKRRVVVSLGLDPEKFTLDANDMATPVVKEQPTQGMVSANPNNYSVGGTIARKAALGVGPGMAGLSAGSTVTEATAPFLGPWSLIPGLAAGIGTSIATAYGQNKAIGATDIGQKFLQDTAAASKQNPHAAIVGDILGQLPSLRPSPEMIGDAGRAFASGRGLVGSAGQVLASPAGQNIALGGALGLGQGLYDQATSNEPMDYSSLALNTLGGLALHRPTSLGTMLPGVHPYSAPEMQRYAGGLDPQYTQVQAAPEATPFPARAPLDQGNLNIKSPETLKSSQAKTDAMARYKASESQNDIATLEGEGGITKPDTDIQNKVNDFYSAKQELDKARLDRLKTEVDKQTQAELVEKARLLEEMKSNQIKPQDNLVKPLAMTETGKEIMPDYTGVKEQANTEIAQESPVDLMARQAEGLGDRYQIGGQQPATEHKVVKTLTDIKGLKEANTAAAARHKGVDFAYEPGETITNPKGKQVTGYQQGNKIRATETKPDTVPHEFAHKFWDEMSPRQKRSFQELMAKDPKAQEWIASERATGRNPGGGVVTPEVEYLAQRSGDMDVARILDKDNSIGKDLTSWFRTNFVGKNATTDDVARWLGNRFAKARTSRASGVVDSGKVVTATQAEGQLDTTGKEEPTKLFHENDRLLSESIKNKDEAGIQKYWRIKKELKNKHFQGHSPEGYALEKQAGKIKEQGVEQKPTTNKDLLDATLPKNFKDNLETEKTLDDMMLKPGTYRQHDADLHDSVSSANETAKDKYWAMKEQLGGDPARNQDKEQGKTDTYTIDTSRQGFLRSLSPQYDQVRKHSIPLSEGFHNYETGRGSYEGAGQVAIKELQKYPREDQVKVENLMDESFRGKTPLDESALKSIHNGDKIKAALSTYYHDTIGTKRKELGMKINGREPGLNENYIPHQLSDNTLDLFTKRGNSPEAKAAKRDWAQHVEKESDGKIPFDDALKNITDYVDALGGDRNNYQSINFGALHKAEGFGIPKTLRETDPVHNLQKYSRRAASDLSFHEHIATKPELMAALKLPLPQSVDNHPAGQIPQVEGVEHLNNQQEVKDAMKIVLGNLGAQSGYNPKFNSVIRVINSAILGPLTGLKHVSSVPVNSLPYIQRLSDFGSALRGIANVREESHNSLATAAKKPNLDQTLVSDVLDSPDRFSKILNTGATLLRKWQGREALINFSRDLAFSVGKELARNNLLAAKAGDAKGTKFLEKFGRLVDGDITTHTGEQLDASLNQIAKNFTDRTQSAFGGSGLPAAVSEGNLSPFLSLQKYGIERSNVIYQDVIKPFISGENRLPLLTYALGSVLTGAALQELNKVLSNRKPQEADWHETLAEATPKNLTTELITLMQLGNFAGIVSDGVKTLSDVIISGRTPRNITSFPTATLAADLQEKLADYSEALQQHSDPWEATKLFALDIFGHNIQALRLLANHTINADDVERSDRFRDLRVYRELEGAPAGEPSKSNKYLDSTVKKYKETGDVQEAADKLPDILDKFQTLVQEQPEKAIRYLRGVKSNSYQTMPVPSGDTMQEFANYYSYIAKLRGDKAASDLLSDYIRQGSINRVKSEMVPSI